MRLPMRPARSSASGCAHTAGARESSDEVLILPSWSRMIQRICRSVCGADAKSKPEEFTVMGHKVNPNGFRLGVIKGWESRWYANRNYKDLVIEDHKLRQLIMKRLANASVSRIEIERVASTQISIAIHTAKPGIVIGKSGESVERLRQALETMTKKDDVAKKVRLSILEIRNPEIDATLVG